MATLNINNIPSPTWGFLGMNGARIERDEGGRDESFAAASAKNETKTENIGIAADGGIVNADISLAADENGELCVFLKAGGSGDIFIKLSANVGEDAVIRLVFEQSRAQDSRLVAQLDADVQARGRFELFSFFPGTRETYVQSNTTLSGDDSRLVSRTFYLGDSGDKLDLNYIASHLGRNTESDITASGALDGSAKKTFRGTIDFRRGSSGSHGVETENVLLLADDIENKTLPVILCEEEDVNGAHGATIGDLSDETLFYFASRGISAADAAMLLKNSVYDSFKRAYGGQHE